MNILFASDFHITEKDLQEVNAIFEELVILKDKYGINRLIIAGDTFDRINPSPAELDCFSKFIRKINLPTILIAAASHESINSDNSVINHFGILRDNVQVLSEYTDDKDLFVGHFTLKESKYAYGATRTKAELSPYKFVILGHQHTYELINPNICHLGSIRYVDFAEARDKEKKVLIIQNYKENTEKCLFLGLHSPYPMVDLICGSNVVQAASGAKIEGGIEAYLDHLPEKTKVRLVFVDFETYKAFLPFYEKFKQKFILFKDKKDFEISVANIAQDSRQMDLKTSMEDYLAKTKVPDIIAKAILDVMEE